MAEGCDEVSLNNGAPIEDRQTLAVDQFPHGTHVQPSESSAEPI